jgi:glycogen debranching enzyme
MPSADATSIAGNEEHRNLPPELGTDAIAVMEGRTFMYSDAAGDVPPGSIGGLVNADTRLLNRWVLTLDGVRMLTLRSGTVEPYSAEFFLTNPALPGLPANTVAIRRRRLMGHSMRESIEVQSFADRPLSLELRISTGTDFADIFEIKNVVPDRSAKISRNHADNGSRLEFRYANGVFHAHTVVDASPSSRIHGDDLVWQLELAPKGEWHGELHIPLVSHPGEPASPMRTFANMPTPVANDPLGAWLAQVPRFRSDSHLLNEVAVRTTHDLAALRIGMMAGDEEIALPAAGLPWFLTVFGRDTIITAYQTISFGPLLARGTLLALASRQGTVCDDFRDEEPGKILHEIRTGELTRLGITPHDPYYGTIDATPLWLILLSEYWRWTGEDEFVRSLRKNALAALRWIDDFGDRDGDGFVEYQTRSRQGLGNQCWRDSWDGVQFADGGMPVLPIASCETQGYVYDAKLRMAELAEGPLEVPELAQKLREQAAALRKRFDEQFWIDDRGGYYALGLDGDKRRIDSLTSNIGHLLWSGIVPEERAAAVVDRLMSEALFSGWGVRTLSTMDAGYNPIGYHLGTVWPHDNSLIVAGLARYGYRDEADRITMALLEAARFSGYRLPEAFSGYPRSYGSFPIPYPTACAPQAWATGAPLLCVRSMLGLEAREGRVTIDPRLPDTLGRIFISGLKAFGERWDLDAVGTAGNIHPAPDWAPSVDPRL